MKWKLELEQGFQKLYVLLEAIYTFFLIMEILLL